MRRLMLAFTALAALGAIASSDAGAQGVLQIAMTAGGIPLATGQTDQGGEGQRFLGYTAHDSLIL